MAMNGGEGPDSYVQNSTYQRGIVEAAIEKINEAIANHFDINALSISPNPICIADLGCSTGPNTFRAMQNIVEAIKLKYISKGGNSKIPDFIVFFNNQVSNDFNTLFKSLPPNRQYFEAGVPGSFHGILFPKASLHFIHSSSAVHWLSNIPMDVMDEGRIFYTNAPKEVKDAYATQFAKDMESILFARAQKLLSGGLLALFLSGIPDVMSNSDSHTGIEIDMIGSCLMDMAKVGLVNEAKVDTFNFPLYFPTPKELKALVERSEYFSFERMAILKNQKKHVTLQSPSMRALFLRAPFEGLLEKQFGNEIMDELFDRYTEKVARSSFFLNPEIDKTIELFVLLKRKI
nr:putative s-adenosylmethionine-dependent methyltransferase at5g37990 [Quercus suber]